MRVMEKISYWLVGEEGALGIEMEMWTPSLGPEMDCRRTLNPSISYAELFLDVRRCILGVDTQLLSDSQRSSRLSKELELLIQGTELSRYILMV